jgi:hypothetical protein
MDAATVQRVVSLIPERRMRSLSGSLFEPAGSERAELLSRFLNWLGPLQPTSKEEQQALGVRAAGKALLESDEEAEEPQVSLPEAGTQIAA